jgi:hypothetical protein
MYGELRDRIEATMPSRTESPSQNASSASAERLPPGESYCPDDFCGGETELVSVSDLLESEDPHEWAKGTALDAKGVEVARRCAICGTVHELV